MLKRNSRKRKGKENLDRNRRGSRRSKKGEKILMPP